MPAFVKQQKFRCNAKLRVVRYECFLRSRPIPLAYEKIDSGEERILMLGFDPQDQWVNLTDIPRGLYHPGTINERLDDPEFSAEYFVRRLLNGDSHTQWMRRGGEAYRTTVEHQSVTSYQDGPVPDHIGFAVMRQLGVQREASNPNIQ